jgi:type I restriction enzyme M protein
MLDTNTKKQLENCRDILVGKVPDPKSQVEQITIALVYKFMDDMDSESLSLGGNKNFFVGDYEKYSWFNFQAPHLSGFDVLSLYSAGIQSMNTNPNIPQLFRDIFKNAYLPYKDPETLRMFLKEINGFQYDHSEKLGDAFEYLLSIMGSQGDAGQFRTPRHIIEFMVDVVKPEKSETILDPSCGTAGFLVSSYKHILQSNTKSNIGDLLLPEERKQISNNIYGYDISPDMIRLSLVNLYLHGFKSPNIFEYDTLTSDDKWDEYYDVILANPPFMTPKGGIRPHRRFSIQSKKSEALFLDYIIEHFSTNGRGAVVVPDGIVANPSNFNVSLRKMALDNGLYCVVSLHGFVFKPYAGAKTSILFFDKRQKYKKDEVLFIRLENDGFERGEQRRKIQENDLPEILKMIEQFLEKKPITSENVPHKIISKNTITGQCSLFANKYIASGRELSIHESVKVIDLFDIKKGTLQSTKASDGEYNFITAAEEWSLHNEYTHDCEALVFAHGASGSLGRVHRVSGKFIASDLCFILTPKARSKYPVNLDYYHAYFNTLREEIVQKLAKGVSKLSINKTDFGALEVDYVPIEIQDDIGSEVKANKDKKMLLEKQIQELNEELEVKIFASIS